MSRELYKKSLHPLPADTARKDEEIINRNSYLSSSFSLLLLKKERARTTIRKKVITI